MKLQLPTKRLQINKAQTTIVATVAIAAFVAVFSIVSCKSLLTQRSYQSKVIAKQTKARDQLRSNLEAIGSLVTSYKTFTGAPENAIGGNPAGTGDRDGDNAKIVLDALPSKYDFPALASSLEKILNDRKFKIGGITGTDDELEQSKNQTSDSPQPIDMPFEVAVEGSYASIQDLVGVFEKSIRPFDIQKLELSGGVSNMQFNMSAKTYFQPEKTLNIKMETVK
ncbi:MAG TPA: hypothetical protein PKA02_02600 [Candidatus Saccharibacteria bacterium]|nr:hypothetical protein [Candidatus Saccharibacteria bacterium]